MLGAAFLDQPANREAVEENARLGRREVLAAVRRLPAPHGPEEAADCPAVIAGRDRRTQPRRASSAARLLPPHPVDEKDDVAILLVHQGLENREHRLRQKTRSPRDLKHAEAEKGVEALAIAEIGESPIEVWPHRIQRPFLDGDAVAVDHKPQQIGVARLLETLQHDRFAHQRIVDGRRIRIDDGAGAPLGIEHFGPERDRAQASQRRGVEVGPGKRLGPVGVVAPDELAAEALLVLVRADLHGADTGLPRHRARRRAKRIRRGTTLGRNRRGS